MFKIKLLILLLISFIFLSCTKNVQNQNRINYSLSYIGGEYEGLVLKNLLINNLSSLNLYGDSAIYVLKPSISHSSSLFITNIDNTSDRIKVTSKLIIEVVDKRFNCVTQRFEESVSQFYIFADSSNYISNNKAVDKIKKENTEALVRNFINTLNNPSYECKKTDILRKKLLSIRNE